MRALGYFKVAPESASESAALTRAFEAFCAAGSHAAQGVFHDDAGSSDRPGWAEMVEHIQHSGLGYLIVIPGAAHLGASLPEQVGRVLEVDALACEMVCDSEETPDPLQNALKARDAPAGRPSRRELIREGMKAKAAQGLGLGRPPYGYALHIDGVLRPVPAEAEVVRSIFRMYLESDQGVRSIARRLNEAGQRTRRGGRWSMVTMRDILRNSAYIGTYRRFGLRIPGTYEPIVGAAEFHQVQERMRARSPGTRHPPAEPFLLVGVLYCGHCGQRMMGVVRHRTWPRKEGGRGQREYRYYQCQSRINQGECAYRTTRAAELEDVVLKRVRELTPEGAELPDNRDLPVERVDPAALRTRLRSLDKRYVELVQHAAAGGMTLAQLREGATSIDAARRSVRASQRGTTEGFEERRALMQAARDKLHYLWEDMDAAERRQTLRALVASVTLTDGEIDVVLR